MTVFHWIDYPSEPKELLLAWQAPQSVPDRLRWAVGRVWKDGETPVFDYLRGDEFAALNLGRSAEDVRAAGYSGYPAFEDNAKRRPQGGFRDRVLEAFLRRLPSEKRSDFPGYLAHYHIRQHTNLSPFAILAATGARLPGDGFSLVDPLDGAAHSVDLLFEITGFRHFGDESVQVHEGDQLGLEPEPSNAKDPHAIRVTAAGMTIGYVNRLQAVTIGGWIRQRAVACWIERLNGRPDLPRAYAFLQVRPAKHSIAA